MIKPEGFMAPEWRRTNEPINEAKKEGTTLSDVIGDCLEKKFGSGKGKVYKPKRDKNALNVGIDKKTNSLEIQGDR
jgi:hypothetical protein